ncbi:MAG: hypothetical protein BMS9Abin07_0801 [Acidimicrobiia bacterium]|nr:MAG: hypothetical protein BMS9Abin07_0801 [Acidimicrobiia bacterium]
MHDRDLALLLLLLVTASPSKDDGHRGGVLSALASRATGAVVDMVDPNELLGRIDVNAILERVDIEAFLARVDLNELLDSIDMDALLERIDVKEIVERAGIPDIVRESTGELAGSVFDLFRRQLVALDAITGRFFYRLTARDPASRPRAPDGLDAGSGVDEEGRAQVSGHYAGPISRLLAFLIDLFVMWVGFIFAALGVAFVLELFFRVEVDASFQRSVVRVVLLGLWAVAYAWTSLALAGRTPGMGIIGLSVVTRQGKPISGRQAFVRTIVFPFSFLFFGVGFLGMFISPERRALHDAAAGDVVVYDWGDRPAEMPAPLTQWLDRHAEDEDQNV